MIPGQAGHKAPAMSFNVTGFSVNYERQVQTQFEPIKIFYFIYLLMKKKGKPKIRLPRGLSVTLPMGCSWTQFFFVHPSPRTSATHGMAMDTNFQPSPQNAHVLVRGVYFFLALLFFTCHTWFFLKKKRLVTLGLS